MKISEVSMTAGDSEILCFSLSTPKDDDQFYIRTMIGMDAPDIVSRTTSFGLYSGQPLVSQAIVDREIVLRVVLNPDWGLREDYSTLRDDIYRGISKSRDGVVTLWLMDEGIYVAAIKGVITKVEVPLFSSTPELQVTIRCPDAMLVAPNAQDILPEVFTSESFSTPFVGTVTDSESTAPHGFLMTAKVDGANTNRFYIQEGVAAGEVYEWQFELNYPFLVDDILTIDTRTRNRGIYIYRGANRIDLMSYIALDSTWPFIYPGANSLELAFTDGSTYSNWTMLTFSHHATYWGI